jgi:hypothetical protein
MSSHGEHGCARRRSGAVECWGNNRAGQLGNGTLVTQVRPRSVVGLPVAVGMRHAAPARAIALAIEQRGRLMRVQEGSVVLNPGKFTLVLRIPHEVTGVFVNASHAPRSYDQARRGARIDTIGGFGETGIAGVLGNPAQRLFVVDTAPNYWYYRHRQDHRFDAPCRRQGQYRVCRRTISQLSYRDGGDVPLSAGRVRTLYLVMAPQREEARATGKSSVQRTTVRIEFR